MDLSSNSGSEPSLKVRYSRSESRAAVEPPLWSSQAPNSSFLSQVRECMQPSMKGAMLGSQLVCICPSP